MRLGTRPVPLVLAATCLATGAVALCVFRSSAAFRPRVLGLDLLERSVRPGDRLGYAIRFRNDGRRGASVDGEVFVHLESHFRACSAAVWSDDHLPLVRSLGWARGATVVDGPHAPQIPPDTRPGTYRVHVGLTATDTGEVLCERDGGSVRVAGDAPDLLDGQGDPLVGGFAPALLSVRLANRHLPPGADLVYSLELANLGSSPALADHPIFVHFERVPRDCGSLAFQDDHVPLQSTEEWEFGRSVLDGPQTVVLPTDLEDGEYAVHVGLHAPDRGDERLIDALAGTIRIDRRAAPPVRLRPGPVQPERLQRQRRTLPALLADPVVLETSRARFALDRASGSFLLVDPATRVVWTSNLDESRHGHVLLRRGEELRKLVVPRFDDVRLEPERMTASARLPLGEGEGLLEYTLTATALDDGGLRLAPRAVPPEGWTVESIRVLDHALGTALSDRGGVVLPRTLGQVLPPESEGASGRRYVTYSDLSMAMFGAVKLGSALLVTWDGSEVELVVHSAPRSSEDEADAVSRSFSLDLRGDARALELRALGRGGHVEIARAYRAVAEERGLRVTLREKIRRDPTAERLLGAALFKPCLFTRYAPGTPDNPGDRERLHLGFTFDEVARLAEHWRNDLEIDRALVVLAGWNRGGYDNQHPTVLPANPRAGGDAGLVACRRRVEACGYVFGLHDNYQDMYLDSPDWDPDVLNRGLDGRAKKGGAWPGGTSYIVCSSLQAPFARRNMAALRELCSPDLHFLDAGLAWSLLECAAPAHPMTRADDLRAKVALCEIAREEIGLCGIEGNREFAVPVCEYMEGPVSRKVRPESRVQTVPLFSMVFGDCVKLFTAQDHEDRLGPGDAAEVLAHVLLAELPMFLIEEQHDREPSRPAALPLRPELVRVERAGTRRLRVDVRWTAGAPLPTGLELELSLGPPGAAQPARDRRSPDLPDGSWPVHVPVETAGFTLELPEEALGGEALLELRASVLREDRRLSLASGDDVRLEYALATLRIADGAIAVERAALRPSRHTFARADGGWAEGLPETDRLIKNVWEVTTWLDRLTAHVPMSSHAFLSPDGTVERTRFDDLVITVNYGEEPVTVGDTVLPRHGFLVESPDYVAFHATRRGELEYPGGALFTLRSLDGAPLRSSSRVRVFHGFGSPRVRVGERVVEVARESVVPAR